MAVITNSFRRAMALFLPVCFIVLICFNSVFSQDMITGIEPPKKVEGKFKQESGNASPEASATNTEDYHTMYAGRELKVRAGGRNKLHVFCHKGEPKTLITLFKTIELRLEIDGDNFRHYEGPNSSFIRQEHQEASWLSFYPWRQRTFKLHLYKDSCVGIEASTDFKIGLRIRWVDFWRVVTLISAVALFFAAGHLAKNVFFHYTTGITFGILGSLLILVYIVARLVPKKSGAVTLMVGGWGLTVYLIQYLWQNFISIVKENHAIAVGYVVVAGLISFAVVYRYGPLTDKRSINLVQWAMQLVALLAIFLSSQYREATLGLVIVMVTYHAIPVKWKSKFQTFWRRRFPPKMRRLTEEEYIQQANEETRKALEGLRVYCRSPKCDAWKTVSRLKSPQRYGSRGLLTFHSGLVYGEGGGSLPHQFQPPTGDPERSQADYPSISQRFVEFVEIPQKRQTATPNTAHRERFAEFVEGGSHLDDEAILAYESNHLTPTRHDEEDNELYITTDDEDEEP